MRSLSICGGLSDPWQLVGSCFSNARKEEELSLTIQNNAILTKLTFRFLSTFVMAWKSTRRMTGNYLIQLLNNSTHALSPTFLPFPSLSLLYLSPSLYLSLTLSALSVLTFSLCLSIYNHITSLSLFQTQTFSFFLFKLFCKSFHP